MQTWWLRWRLWVLPDPMVMGDGSVRLISWQIDATVWRQMGER